jgi:DNA-binding NarL/FixJ family response regulator
MPYANVEFRQAYDRARNKKRKPHMSLPKSERKRRVYLSDYEHQRILYYRKHGVPMTEIARALGVSYSTVTHIVYGRSKPRMRR